MLIKVSIWPRGFLRFWYLCQGEIIIQEIVFISYHFYYHEIKLQSSRFGNAPQGCGEFFGLVTDDVKTGILASEVSCLHEFRVIC